MRVCACDDFFFVRLREVTRRVIFLRLTWHMRDSCVCEMPIPMRRNVRRRLASVDAASSECAILKETFL